MQKKCPRCGLCSSRKNGKRNNKQRYRCNKCNAVWWWKAGVKVDYNALYDEYCLETKTYATLWKKYGVSIRTIQKWLDLAVYKKKYREVPMIYNNGYNIFEKLRLSNGI